MATNIFTPIINVFQPSKEEVINPYLDLLEAIQQKHQSLIPQSDEELQAFSENLMLRAQSDEIINDLLVPAYALVKEVCRRQLKLTAYEVQITAAIALHQGQLINMQTGEGKTLAAAFPAYLNALRGKGVHILTFNDYLSKRDALFLAPVYRFLGLSVGFIQEQMPQEQKRKAYHSDITYATAKAVGFDYLRSFMAYEEKELLLPPFHFAIVDEADALLIDEARHPLVLAGNLLPATIDFYAIVRLAASLKQGVDFDLNDYEKNIFLREEGIAAIEQGLNIFSLQAVENHQILSAIILALHARMLLKRDIDYIVRNEEIKLVDEFTGRIAEDRKWRNGLQTAVEAKEALPIQSEGIILNSISLQHFIRHYPKLAGMTATAELAKEELKDLYGLEVIAIPPNKTCVRVDHPDLVFANPEAKVKAIIQEVKTVHKTGRPILIGTLTVKESEALAKRLREAQITCQVLNAKNVEVEAELIARAGDLGAVTISTNMAGRGTDILLGGSEGKNRAAVIQLGGLYVIGSNRHESKRIDQQLRGRAGRQGDVGASRFFVSLEDPLMIKYHLEEVLPTRYKRLVGEAPIDSKRVNKLIDHTQRVIEGQSYDMRKRLVEYADFIESQRLVIQQERQRILLQSPLYADWLPRQLLEEEQALLQKIKTVALYHYDYLWAAHLNDMQQIRDGIHLVRIGGQHPLREFKRQADGHFQELQIQLNATIRKKVKALLENPETDLATIGVQRPGATWTYIISDEHFGDQLSIMLLDNSNIGLHVDFISVLMLFIFSFFKRKN